MRKASEHLLDRCVPEKDTLVLIGWFFNASPVFKAQVTSGKLRQAVARPVDELGLRVVEMLTERLGRHEPLGVRHPFPARRGRSICAGLSFSGIFAQEVLAAMQDLVNIQFLTSLMFLRVLLSLALTTGARVRSANAKHGEDWKKPQEVGTSLSPE